MKLPLLSLLFGLTLSTTLQAQEQRVSPLPSHMPLGQEACFGRTYDAAHLKQHPKQRVTSFHLFRDFTPDPTKEMPQDTREKMIEDDGQGSIHVMAYVRFRDRPGLFFNGLSCNPGIKGGVHCGIDCDGGGFHLKPSTDSLLLENEGFVVIGGCGASEDEAEQADHVSPGADDKVFRLDRKPVAECRALEDSRKPQWAALGAPLRERLDTESAVCFTRSYDAAHLSKHPKQTVRRIAVLKVKGDKRTEDEFPYYNFVFRVELKNGQRAEKTTQCGADQYAFACTHNAAMDTQRDFYLTRAGKNHMMLRDRRGAMNKMFDGLTLGADDRIFKLEQAAASACEF
jgi:hypothetical protein